MNKSLLSLVLPLVLAATVLTATAGPTIYADPYPAGSNQPTSCTVDVSGKPYLCTLIPQAGGIAGVVPTSDLAGLTAGEYVVTMTVVTIPLSCSVTAVDYFSCGGYGGSSGKTVTLKMVVNSSPNSPFIRLKP